MGFGKQLKNVLEEIDMSVAALSRETGIASTTLYSIIDRDTDNVGLEKVKKIEKAVNAIQQKTQKFQRVITIIILKEMMLENIGCLKDIIP